MALSTTLSITDVGINNPMYKTIPSNQFGCFCFKQIHQSSFLQIPINNNNNYNKLKNFIKSRRFPSLGSYGNGAKDTQSLTYRPIDNQIVLSVFVIFYGMYAFLGWIQSKPVLVVHLTNVSEDTDDMYDDLFKKYGKVVYRSNDQKSPTAEVDDDAESLSFAIAMAKIASDVKAGDIKVMFVKPLVYWTRFFIIVTAFSRPQSNAIGSRIRDAAEEKYGKIPSGDTKPNSWTLLDFGDVVIHIFLPEQREFYNLEEFYANATVIDLPFENQPPFRS
ncbi:hypothetical protein ACFE04_023137 [Oxalis oulophora]